MEQSLRKKASDAKGYRKLVYDVSEKKASFLSFFRKSKPVAKAIVPSAGGRLVAAKNALRAEMSARLGMKRLSALIPEMEQLKEKGLKGDAFVSAARELGRSRIQPVVESTRDAIIRRLYEIAKRHSFDADWKGTWSRVSRFGVRTARDNPERVLEEVSRALRTESGRELGDNLSAAFESGWKYNGSPSYSSDVNELLSWLPVKKAEYRLKDNPTYGDAASVFNRLSFADRANIAPRHPDYLRDVPKNMLFDRQVAVDENGNPVGFNEFYYGKDRKGRRQPPHNSMGVVPEARGHGLSKLMVEAAIRKAKKEKIKRLVWEAFADNEPSIRAALSAGFEDATPKNAKEYRRFVYRVPGEKKGPVLYEQSK